jgi:hypothetical protein
VFHEAATLLYNGLALDGLDGHDASAVVDGLCVDLVAEDPGVAFRAHVPRHRWRLLESYKTQKECQRPT